MHNPCSDAGWKQVTIAKQDITDQHHHNGNDCRDHSKDLRAEKLAVNAERIHKRFKVCIGIIIKINCVNGNPFGADALLFCDQKDR